MALMLSPQMMVSVTCPMEVTEAVAHSRAKSTIRGVLTWGSTALGSLALSMSVCWLSHQTQPSFDQTANFLTHYIHFPHSFHQFRLSNDLPWRWFVSDCLGYKPRIL